MIEHGDKTVFSHPLGLPLLVAPLLWLQDLLAPGAAPDLLLGLLGLGVTFLALLEGLRLLMTQCEDPRVGLLVGLTVYFTTPLWFYSRTFFTEPYVVSGLVIALGLLNRQRILAASLLLGLTFLIKETAVLAILPILVWAGWKRGAGAFLRLSIVPFLALLLFALKNLWIYGEWWVTFQPFQIGSPWWNGFLGLMVDSEHGLLPFAPIALMAIGVWAAGFKPGQVWQLDASRLALLILVAYYGVTALWIDWRGGSGYGPRLLVPALPALALPLVSRMDSASTGAAWRRLFAVLAVVGFAIQWSAVTNPFRAFWSTSLRDLVIGRPVPFLSGLLLGSLAMMWLARQTHKGRRAVGPGLR